jgi:hypothetical protein
VSDLVNAIPEGIPVTVLNHHPEPEPEPEAESYDDSETESSDEEPRRSRPTRTLLRSPNSDEPSEPQLHANRVTPDEMGLERPAKPVVMKGTQDGGEAERVLLHRSERSLEALIVQQIRQVEEDLQRTQKSKRGFRGLRSQKVAVGAAH